MHYERRYLRGYWAGEGRGVRVTVWGGAVGDVLRRSGAGEDRGCQAFRGDRVGGCIFAK